MKILIDNGHGENTPGKRSPDGRFREYKYNREIARAVVEHLQLRGARFFCHPDSFPIEILCSFLLNP